MHAPTMSKINEAATAPPNTHPRNFETFVNGRWVLMRMNVEHAAQSRQLQTAWATSERHWRNVWQFGRE